MTTIAQVPTKPIARTRTLRDARMGTQRHGATSVNYVDAFATVESLQRLKEAFIREKSTIPVFQALSDAWTSRKDSDAYPTP